MGSGSGRNFNVLLITIDTTRADRLGSYGYRHGETPVLDRLAAEGVRYSDAVATVPMTLPSHATILTGLDPPNHGVRSNGTYRLGESHVTLAEVLQQNGYLTAAFVACFVLDSRYGLDQGFDLYDARVATTQAQAFGQGNERPARAVSDAAIAWLLQEELQQPFFAWVHYFDPHHPYDPPPPFAERFRSRPYDGEIAYVDSQIGRLVAALEKIGVTERTLIVVAGDHGESLGEHSEDYHSRTIYEAAMRVPLILWSPALTGGGAVIDGVVVSLADIFPTVLDLLGLQRPRSVDGVTLRLAASQDQRMVYMETLATYLDNGWAPLYGLRRHSDKLILAPQRELYDLRNDPDELRNLYYEEDSEIVRQTALRLEAELAQRLAAWPSLESAAHASAPLDPETRRRLQALGYVSGDEQIRTGELADPKLMLPLRSDFLKAKALAQAERFGEAVSLLQSLLKRSPLDREARQLLSEVYARTGRRQEAETELRKILEDRPSGDAALLLAQVLMASRRFSEADALLDQAAALDPKNGAVFIARGDLLVFRGRLTESLALYQQAEQEDPYRSAGVVQARIAAVRRELARRQP